MGDWLYSPSLPLLLNGLDVTDADGNVIEIQFGEVEFTGFEKRTVSRWRQSVPLGSTVPTRRLSETPRAQISIRGDLVAGRFAEGQARLRSLEALVGQTVTLLWHLDRTTGSYTVDDVDVRWRIGHGLRLGAEFSLRFTETTAPTVAPTGGTAPGFSGLTSQQFSIGVAFGPLTIATTVQVGAQAAGGYYISVSGLPSGLVFTAPATISGTPTAAAKAGEASLNMHEPDGDVVATGKMPFMLV